MVENGSTYRNNGIGEIAIRYVEYLACIHNRTLRIVPHPLVLFFAHQALHRPILSLPRAELTFHFRLLVRLDSALLSRWRSERKGILSRYRFCQNAA